MKYIAIGFLIILSLKSYSQRVERFTDSLTVNLERTWVDINGSQFTELGKNCDYGIEVTFMKKSSQAVVYQCHEGEWKKFDYEYKVITKNEEHFVEFYETRVESVFWFFRKKVKAKVENYEFEVQMLSNDENNFVTVLTLYDYSNKRNYTLRSID